MIEVGTAIVSLCVTVISLMTLAAVTLGPTLISRQKKKLALDDVRLDLELEELRRRASDKAVASIEDLSRGQDIHGVDKVTMAQRMAEAATPKGVTVDSTDIRAAVTRMKASMPATGSLAPLSIPVQLVSSTPPQPVDETRPTPAIPRPARTPQDLLTARDTSREKAPLR